MPPFLYGSGGQSSSPPQPSQLPPAHQARTEPLLSFFLRRKRYARADRYVRRLTHAQGRPEPPGSRIFQPLEPAVSKS